MESGKTYLITGGCGGLGLIFAEYLSKEYSANLILTGRSALDESKRAKLGKLADLGGQVLYLQADVCDANVMKEGLDKAKERFGKIHGVIHAAGIAGKEKICPKPE